jgi:EAL domain-containing protein (putative c-di-GMP-specific phosphodiesterase class I)
VPVIIDINAAALADDTFVPSVAQMLQVAAVTPAAIGFRALSLDLAKQSLPSFQNLLKLLQRGHSVWLTRFANAVTDSTLDGAFVEVTATYLQRLCDNPEGRDLVTQLLQVWRNAGVKLVAVDVQSPGQRAFVKDLGIGYAIGPAAAG